LVEGIKDSVPQVVRDTGPCLAGAAEVGEAAA